MKCSTVQRRLLTLEDAARVPSTVQSHLDTCAACREWQQRVFQLERVIPLLHVPSSSFAKARVLQQIRTPPTLWEQMRERAARLPEHARRIGHLRLASGVAAAVLLLIMAWQLMPGGPRPNNNDNPNPASDALLATLLERNLILAEAVRPRQQAETLASVADDLHGEAQTLGRHRDARASLDVVAIWYSQVVKVEVERAGRLPAEDRKTALEPMAQRLAKAEAEAEALVRDFWHSAPNHPLLTMAADARKAREQLEALRGQTVSQREMRLPATPASTVATAGRVLRQMPMLPAPVVAVGSIKAQEPGLASEAVRRFEKNRTLLQALVNGSVKLAVEDDLVKRAEVCKGVSKYFADEIQNAAVNREGTRAVELGQHLRDLLQRGVAANLTAVVAATPEGSTRQEECKQVGREVTDVLGPLQDRLQNAVTPESQEYMQRTLQAVQDGRQDVEKSLKKGPPNPPEIRTVP
ncbi:MAG: hypothetical protein K2R98_31990 [Gemmataceae bacterium]|nr:hypothetical protein [Gemmataceae bacterium]